MHGILISTRLNANASDKPRSGVFFVETASPQLIPPARAKGAPAGLGVQPVTDPMKRRKIHPVPAQSTKAVLQNREPGLSL